MFKILCQCQNGILFNLKGAQVAWEKALNMASIKLSDLSFVETHDCFTIAELIEYEAMGTNTGREGSYCNK